MISVFKVICHIFKFVIELQKKSIFLNISKDKTKSFEYSFYC